MKVDRFISRRITAAGTKGFSRSIVRVAMTAVGISLAVMILSSGLIAGFQKEISTKVFGFWGHIHITHADSDRSVEAIPLRRQQDFYPFLDTITSLEYYKPLSILGFELPGRQRLTRTEGGIRHIQTFINLAGIISAGDQYEGIICKGVGMDFDWSHMRQWLREGRLPVLDESGASREILISQTTADRLRLEVGDPIVLNFIIDRDQIKRRVDISGIFNSGMGEYDKKFAILDYRLLQRVLRWEEDQVSGFEIFVDRLEDLEVINEYIYFETLPANMYSETIRSRFPAIFQWLQTQDINEVVIMTVLLVVAFINMVTMLIILILERTRMIGTLKALGAGNRMIQRIFLRLAARIILYGLVAGNIIALSIGFAQEKWKLIRLNEVDYYISYAPVHFDWLQILALNIGSVVAILLFLAIPSFLVMRIDPIRALRFE